MPPSVFTAAFVFPPLLPRPAARCRAFFFVFLFGLVSRPTLHVAGDDDAVPGRSDLYMTFCPVGIPSQGECDCCFQLDPGGGLLCHITYVFSSGRWLGTCLDSDVNVDDIIAAAELLDIFGGVSF